MQDGHACGDASDIDTGLAQLACEGFEKLAGIDELARIGQEPANERMRFVWPAVLFGIRFRLARHG
jgi:hypothetical protein